MPAMVKFECFALDLADGKHDLNTDTLKVALTNTAPDEAADTVLTDIAEIAATGGYVAGGYALDSNTLSEVSGTAKLDIADETITAAGGSVGPFRYFVVYNDSEASDALMFYYDYGSALTLADGESITIDFDDNNGVLTIS